MVNTPKRVALIGLDGAVRSLIEKHIADGHLPTFKKLFQEGVVAENSLVPYPTITPPNWASIATGAWPGTHGVTDFHVQEPGAPLDRSYSKSAFSSERVHAEYIWDAMDKVGKRCIVLNYPGAWPSHMQNGIVVGGAGLAIGEFRDGMLQMNYHVTLCLDQLITNGIYPGAIQGNFEAADGWVNGPEMGDDPLEMEASLRFANAKNKPVPTSWYVLARQTGEEGYDRVTLSPTKDFNDAFCTMVVGEWSQNIVTKIKMEEGAEREVIFSVKLIELTDDAEDFRLFISGLVETSGWSSPPEVAGQLVARGGTPILSSAARWHTVGWFGLDTFVEINELYNKWLADAATTLLSKNNWDGFFMHAHSPDWTYHLLITAMDPALTPDEAKRKEAWDAHLKIFEAQDRMIAQILQVLDSDTLVILVSDHGATPDGIPFNPYNALIPAGLAVPEEKGVSHAHKEERKKEGLAMMSGVEFKPVSGPKKSRAIPLNSCYVYVNLKGRDPNGIVEPEDYEKVQQEIIDALYRYVDPETGKRPISLALSKQDARIIGLYGSMIGDVVYALYPWFGGQHGHILPTAEFGIGTVKNLLTLTGPGIKRGHRLQRTVWLTDIVPTICYLMDLPVPAQAEGSVAYQAFEDPNFKLKEITMLKETLKQMEEKLAGETT